MREKEERAVEGWRGEKKNGNRGMTGFFVIFGLNFLHPQAMKYMGKLATIDSVGKDINRWFKVVIMNCQIWQFKVVWVGLFGPTLGRCDVNRAKRTILGDKGMLGDHFGSCVVNFGGHMRH